MRALVVLCFVVASCVDADRLVVEPDGGTPAHDDFDSRTIALGGGVQEFNYMPNSAVTVAGVRVCQHEPRRCTEATEFGGWLLDGLKPEREILLTYEKAGFLTLYQPIVTPKFSSELTQAFITPYENAAGLGRNTPYDEVRDAEGLPPADSKHFGSIAFSALMTSEMYLDRTVHVQLKPDIGVAPMYALTPDYTIATDIPENATAVFGLILNVPEGEYELEYTMDDGACTRLSHSNAGWPAKDGRSNVTRVPAAAGAITYFTAQTCVRNDEPLPEEWQR